MHVHLIGIAGVGMRALADLLLTNKYKVSGSDIKSSYALDLLTSKGAKIYQGHSASYVEDADLVVRSSAISDQHVEWQTAVSLNKKLLHRSEMLTKIFASKKVIAVTGAHGKTTTTAMIAHVLRANGHNPSFAIGSSWAEFDCGACYSDSDWAVIEADESDGSFLRANVDLGVVLNIEPEHMDFYENSVTKLHDSYKKFMDSCKQMLVYPSDDQVAANIAQGIGSKISFGPESDVSVHDLGVKNTLQKFRIIDAAVVYSGECAIVGKHQLHNIAAAYAACKFVGVTAQQFITALENFVLPGRRFEVLGPVPGYHNTLVIDDYGHHPTEIRASMQALKTKYPDRRIIHVFQPHKFSRLRDFFPEFVESLLQADKLVITAVYAAGEERLEDFDGHSLYLQLMFRIDVEFADNLDVAEKYVHKLILPGDIVFCQGAGSITQLAHTLLKEKTNVRK